jgi:hypothetical protein
MARSSKEIGRVQQFLLNLRKLSVFRSAAFPRTMPGVGEEWESGALREQGMRAGPVPILSSPNVCAALRAMLTVKGQSLCRPRTINQLHNAHRRTSAHVTGALRSAITSMPPVRKKRKTREALMDVLLVLNSLIMLFSHWAGPRR